MTTSYVQTCQTRPFAVTTQFAACGVVYRWTTNAFVEFLLIKKRGDWTLPKGQLLEGEPADVAALREVAEETGLRGVLHGELLLHLQETFSDVVKTDKTGLSKTAHTRWMISAFANFLPGSTIFRLA